MSWIRTPVTNRQTCPGIRHFLRPTVHYVPCPACGGTVEIWSDEAEGRCMACGTPWVRPNATASCLQYCTHADQCRQIIQSHKGPQPTSPVSEEANGDTTRG